MKRFRRRSGTGLLLDTKSYKRNNLINYNEISFYQNGKDVVIRKWKEAFSDDDIPAAFYLPEDGKNTAERRSPYGSI
jgi:hypothetical protein